jgi:N-acetylmuramoyl-L-alanine amidase
MRASSGLRWGWLALVLGAWALIACPSGRAGHTGRAGPAGPSGDAARVGVAAPAPAERPETSLPPAIAEPGSPAGATGEPAVAGGPGAAAPGDGAPAGEAPVAAAPDGGLLSVLTPVRVPRPAVPPGPRRIGLQAGHWLTNEVPEELRRLEHSVGTSGGGVMEWQVNLQVANRAAAILRSHGYQVDVLPTTIPEGYLADVFLALHADGSTDPAARGFKAAHGNRRGPYEGQLVQVIGEEYGRATGLPVDPMISRNMRGYYAFSWSRYQSTVAPHTPAAILEMGFMTNAADRSLLLSRQDVVVTGVVSGLQRFLDEVPAGAAFAEDLILPPAISFRSPPAPR